MPTAHADLIDQLGGFAPGGTADTLRRWRHTSRQSAQDAYDALFGATEGSLTQTERHIVAARIARIAGANALCFRHIDALAALDTTPAQHAAAREDTLPVQDPRLTAILRYAEQLAREPANAHAGLLDAMLAHGLSADDIVLLSQLVGFLAYLVRLLAGLTAQQNTTAPDNGVAASAPAASVQAAATAVDNGAAQADATPPAAHAVILRAARQGYELDTIPQWHPLLPPLAWDDMLPGQQDAVTRAWPGARQSPFFTLLARHGDVLRHRMAVLNDIMYAPRGLSRAEREFAVTALSRLNGCRYCAIVHAQLHVQLSKQDASIWALFADGVNAQITPRQAAILRYAARLGLSPQETGPADILDLQQAGFTAQEIFDLTQAIAIFSWANRLMLALGKPVAPGESDPFGLDALADNARQTLAYTSDAPAAWTPLPAGVDHNVLIVGAGQTGLSLALALRKAGIGHYALIDQADAGEAGVWRDTARMRVLRSSKTLPGPEQGVALLSFRAWYEARFGLAAYSALERCPRETWAAYIDWFAHATQATVEHGTRLLNVAPHGHWLQVTLAHPGGTTTTRIVRKLVLATGMNGGGTPAIPAILSGLPAQDYTHTEQAIDFTPWRGKRIGILGAASSAFDAAAAALEQGALRADLFGRHADLAHITPIKAMAYDGALDHFHALPDADRWALMHAFLARAAGPMPDTVRRATTNTAFHLHLNTQWASFARVGPDIVGTTADGRTHRFDHLILGTGYRFDLRLRPELQTIAADIALWQDRYQPPANLRNEALSTFPYLDDAFGLQARQAGTAPHLRHIFCYNAAAGFSHGRAAGEIASLRHGIPRLVERIGRDLFLEDRQDHLDRLGSFNLPDLTGDEYRHAVVP